MSTYADTETQPSWGRLLGVSFDAAGNATLIAKPPFMRDVAGEDTWTVPGLPGTVHMVWTTLGTNVHVVHATTDGVKWSVPDSGFSAPFGTLPGANVVAAAGDDLIVALPAVDEWFSGVVVGIRAHGVWDVARLSVPHKSLWELPLAASIDRSGATIAYFHMLPSQGGVDGDSVAPGLYARHRPWGPRGSWGAETRVLDHPGHDPIPLQTADGVFHLFWRGLLADSAIMHHATTRDYKNWRLAESALPKEIQHVDVAPEDAGVRIVLAQTDDPNGMDMKYSNLLSGTWGPSGFSSFETVPNAKPAGSAVISRLSADTEAVVWSGMRLATQSTRHPGNGPSKWQSYVPVTILARHVRRCAPTTRN